MGIFLIMIKLNFFTICLYSITPKLAPQIFLKELSMILFELLDLKVRSEFFKTLLGVSLVMQIFFTSTSCCL